MICAVSRWLVLALSIVLRTWTWFLPEWILKLCHKCLFEQVTCSQFCKYDAWLSTWVVCGGGFQVFGPVSSKPNLPHNRSLLSDTNPPHDKLGSSLMLINFKIQNDPSSWATTQGLKLSFLYVWAKCELKTWPHVQYHVKLYVFLNNLWVKHI